MSTSMMEYDMYLCRTSYQCINTLSAASEVARRQTLIESLTRQMVYILYLSRLLMSISPISLRIRQLRLEPRETHFTSYTFP